MKIMQQETLHPVLKKIAAQGRLSNQLLPWNWLGDEVIKLIANASGHSWPDNKLNGYCVPFKTPVSIEGSSDLYWAYFVANYGNRSNPVVESVELEYCLYIEGETEHFYAPLTGWTISRMLGEETCREGVITGIVDYERRVIFEHYYGLRQHMEWFSRTLMLREIRRGDAYLACFASHLHNAIYNKADTSRCLPLPIDRPLKQLVWGI